MHSSAPSAAVKPSLWIPLLEGEAATRASQALDQILADLEVQGSAAPAIGGSLAGGWPGLALLYAYLDRARPGEGWRPKAQAALDTAIRLLGEEVMPPGLYSGFTGIAWTMEHFQGLDPEPSGEDPNQDIDEALLGFLGKGPWTSDYDLISGLAGYGVYALDRLGRASGRTLLDTVIARLDEVKVEMGGGLTWFTPPDLLPPWQRELNPDGYYNLGLAHGVPAVLAVLARAAAAGHGRALELLEGGVAWLLAQRNPHGSPSCFATVVSAGPAPNEPSASRIAWCYGDLGLAAALLLAAREVHRPDWEIHALDIARHAAATPLDQAGVRDGGLCHGAAGNAHLFNRLFQATGEGVFRDAALAYYDQLLTLRREGRGVGGFEAWMPAQAGDGDPWKTVPGLLEGGVGIALALLGGLHPVLPGWDRFLLVDVPPASVPGGAGS